MKMCHVLVALVILLPVAVHAGDIKTKVRKDAIIVSPMDIQGTVVVSGPPGCVMGLFPIQILARNKETDVTVRGAVNPDGGFSVRLPAGPKDSIKLTFIGANGKDKKVKVKVPKAVLAVPPPPVVERTIERTTITIPGGAPVAGDAASSVPGADEITTGEEDLRASGVIE